MANKFMDTALLDKAIVFAVKAHANSERRGKGFPYIVHPMEAVEIVATITPDQELLAAAALHDTVEDTDVTVEEIRAEFGERIARLVDAESDKFTAGVSETDSWRDRKQAAIDRLAAADIDAKIVAMGDKLSNMRAIARDYETQGDKLWNLFHAPNGKPDHEWHYRGLADSLLELDDTFAYHEFVSLINQVFGQPGADACFERAEKIDMADYVQSGDGYTAISYNHKDGKRMVKLYSGFIPRDVPQKELRLAQAVLDMGLPTPAPKRFVTDGQRVGAEFVRIAPKESFARAISNHPEKLEYYATQFAYYCKNLHSTPIGSKETFPHAADVFRGYVDATKDFTPAEKTRLYAFLDSVSVRETCLHGDMHIGNIITNDHGTWWIDLADFAWGNPLYDLGMFYLACHCNPEEMTQNLYHLSNAQMLQVWDIFRQVYFNTDNQEWLAENDAIIAKFAALKMIGFANRAGITREMKSFIRGALLR